MQPRRVELIDDIKGLLGSRGFSAEDLKRVESGSDVLSRVVVTAPDAATLITRLSDPDLQSSMSPLLLTRGVVALSDLVHNSLLGGSTGLDQVAFCAKVAKWLQLPHIDSAITARDVASIAFAMQHFDGRHTASLATEVAKMIVRLSSEMTVMVSSFTA